MQTCSLKTDRLLRFLLYVVLNFLTLSELESPLLSFRYGHRRDHVCWFGFEPASFSFICYWQLWKTSVYDAPLDALLPKLPLLHDIKLFTHEPSCMDTLVNRLKDEKEIASSRLHPFRSVVIGVFSLFVSCCFYLFVPLVPTRSTGRRFEHMMDARRAEADTSHQSQGWPLQLSLKNCTRPSSSCARNPAWPFHYNSTNECNPFS